MNLAVAVLVCAALTGPPGDTIVQVRQGDRLVLPRFQGVLDVQTWDRDEIEVLTDGESSADVRVQRSASRLELQLRDRGDRASAAELTITLPPWMALEVTGQEFDARVSGLTAVVTIRNLEGDLTLRDLAGEVDVYSVEGEIEARGLTGVARLRSGEEEIRVIRSSAALELETVEGDIRLEEVTGWKVSAHTTSGDIDFSGSIPSGADYNFRSHSGDIELRLLPPVNLNVSVLAYEGDFESDFPARTRGFNSGESFRFTLGQGGGSLSLETFSGDLSLVDPTLAPVTPQTYPNRYNPRRKP